MLRNNHAIRKFIFNFPLKTSEKRLQDAYCRKLQLKTATSPYQRYVKDNHRLTKLCQNLLLYSSTSIGSDVIPFSVPSDTFLSSPFALATVAMLYNIQEIVQFYILEKIIKTED